MHSMADKRVRRMPWIASLAAAFAVCATTAATPARAVDALPLLPDRAEAVVGMDFSAVRGLALYQRLEARFDLSQKLRLEEITAFTGVEVREDLDRLTVGVWGPSGSGQDFLAVLEGNLQWREQALEEMSARGKSFDHRGIQLFQVQPREVSPAVFFAALSERMALVGRRDAVLEAIDRSQGATTERSAPTAALQAEAETAAERGQLWMVAGAAALQSGAAVGLLESGVPGLMDSVESLSVSANLLAGLDLILSGRCADAATAMSMSTAAQGLLMMARLNAPRTEIELQQLLNGLQVRAVDSRVELSAGFDEAQLIDLFDAAERRGLANMLP